MKTLRRLVPSSLAGQLITLLLLALVGGQIVAFAIFSDERREAIEETTRGQVLKRTATLVRLLDATPEHLHERIIGSASTPLLVFSLDEEPSTDRLPQTFREKILVQRLKNQLGPLAKDIRIKYKVKKYSDKWRRWSGHHDDDDDDDRDEEYEDDDDDTHFRRMDRHRPFRKPRDLDLELAVNTASGLWVNAKTEVGAHRPAWAAHTLVALLVTAIAVVISVILVVRRITRPMRQLTLAAEGFGRGEKMDDVTSAGPDDIRRSIDAFNQMRHRLERYIEDRTNMLAAVSHDLKTPITALRIRAEFIEDEDLKNKIIQILDEMQAITESTLNFAREDAEHGETRQVDLTALLDSLSADYQDLGHDVTFLPANRVVFSCRPDSLKRALSNVLDNAIAYGERAKLKLTRYPDTQSLAIIIEDNGSGIADDDLDRVFQPFVRLEQSRSRETGGSGLGLAIARSIVRGHGGEIKLENMSGGGLRVTIQLPVATIDAA
jgi:signal transduction histidine kinase